MRLLIYIILTFISLSAFGQFTQPKKLKLGNGTDSQMIPVCVDSGIVFMSNERTNIFKTVMDESNDLPFQLFYVKTDSSKKIGKKELFSENLATNLNNGPISFNGTANYAVVSLNQSTQNKKGKNLSLGLYFTNKNSDGWSLPVSFEYNSKEYSITHPALSPNGKTLVFSSKQEDEIPSLFYSMKKENRWTKPKMISKKVNSEHHDIFPSFFGNNTLYFSSNRDSMGLDIWRCSFNGDQFVNPVKLDSTINSTADDFGISFNKDGKSGYMTSNRDGNDAIYYFENKLPSFDSCQLQQEIYLCYDFEETDIELEEGTPFVFEWDFGDGVKKRGKIAEHCFEKPGNYVAKVSLIDTLGGESFYNISEVQVDISVENQHAITTEEELILDSPVKFKTTFNWADYEQLENFWEINGEISFDKELSIANLKNSSYEIKSLVVDTKGETHCVVKNFKITE